MNKILMLALGLFLNVVTGYNQTAFPGFVDGKLYVRLKSTINPQSGAPLSINQVSSAESPLPLVLTQLSPKYKIKSHGRAFREKASDKINRTITLQFDNYSLASELIKDLIKDPNVELAEKIPLDQRQLVPNDLSYSSQWHLNRINAPLAWDYFSAGSNIVIAIVDDAVERFHPDLNANVWVNSKEIPNNAIDDDNNGYIDDINGWDLADNDNTPDPPGLDYDHGTHVAGISSAVTNNSLGISSIGFSCKLMCLKASGANPNSISQGYAGVLYAANNGAHIVNMSWGSGSFSTTNEEIINYALSRNVILIAAAGNNNSSAIFYPAGYNGVVSVASTTTDDSKSSFSNFGTWIKISAPGSAILSTVPFGNYASNSGTSMASPMVAGLVGLMKSLNPGMPNEDLIQCLYNSADNLTNANPGFPGQLGAGRINAGSAMACVAATLNNAPIAEFTGTPTTIVQGNSVIFTENSLYNATNWQWSFPGGTPSTFTGRNPPAIVYNTPGVYNVSLFASNSFGDNTRTRNNYITVNELPSCLSINLPRPGTWSNFNYFSGPGAVNGFANGNNSDRDRQKAMYFDVSNTNAIGLVKIEVWFGRANASDLNKIIRFRVFDGTNETPGAELGVFEQTMGQIRQAVLANSGVSIDLPRNILLPASKKFFLSVDFSTLEWNSTTKDTLSILSNLGNQSVGTPVFDQKSDGTWRRYGTSGTWTFENLSLYIHPFITSRPAFAVVSPINPEVCQGSSVTFSSAGSNFSSLLRWNTPNANGSGTIDNQASITPQYNNPGTFKVYLAATGGCGEIRLDSTMLTIKSAPVIVVNAAKNPICQGESTSLTASGASDFQWSPSTGLSSTTGASVTANPTTTTNYSISATVGGCTSVLPFELLVRGRSADVVLNASSIDITSPSQVTFTANGTNGGSNPVFEFRVNDALMQSGISNVFTATVSPGDRVKCQMNSTEPCVDEKSVTSNEIKMGETIVPVTMGTLRGQRIAENNLLQWNTLSEFNTSHFEVERSTDGNLFTPIERVNAIGFSQGNNNYQYTDKNVRGGTWIYRLKIVDFDDTFGYSAVLVVSGSQPAKFVQVFPNPAPSGNPARLIITGLQHPQVTIRLVNQTGQILNTWQPKVSNQQINMDISTEKLPDGTYFIQVIGLYNQYIENIRLQVIR